MKRAVSVSLGSPKRDKRVVVDFHGTQISVERVGTGGDAQAARRLFTELDGQVDALSVGGIDLYVHLDGRDYPIRAALKLVRDVHRTPLVDGRMLKYALEGRVFERAEPLLGEMPHFRRAFIPFGTDRIGLISAVSQVADEVLIGDLMFMFGVPYPVRGLARFKRLAHLLLPVAGFLPISVLFPPGVKDEAPHPKYQSYWQQADLIAGDMHYIRKYACADLRGKFIITNTTTEENIAMLRERGARLVLTTTPIYEGRSFGVNMMEGVLTAYAGKGRPLDLTELNNLIDELDLRPTLQILNATSQ
ncbi:MAG: quinate 5-dehydrogenase [Chloroflexota bacterium]